MADEASEYSEFYLEPRKRRAAVKPSIKDFSDSEDEAPAPKKRPRKRKDSSDEEFREPWKDASTKQPRARAPAKPKAVSKERAPRKKATASLKDLDFQNESGKITDEEYTDREKQSSSLKLIDEDQYNDDPDRHGDWVDQGSNASQPDSSPCVQMEWKESDLLAENEGLRDWVANNLVKLFEDDNTIPFIARYRKEMTGNMEPEQLRHVRETFEEIKLIKHKATNMLKGIEKLGKLSPTVRRSIVCAKSMNELDLINTPFKAGSKRTLAERARQLGLEQAAQTILDGSDTVILNHYVNHENDGLKDASAVQLGLQHIIADTISKDRGVLDYVAELRKSANIRLESSRAKGIVSKDFHKGSSKEKMDPKMKRFSQGEKQKLQTKADEESKYRNYFEFGMNVKYIKPHQILAINRGESQKELTVKVVIPEFILDKLLSFCQKQWSSKGAQYELRHSLILDSIKDAYSRLIQPLIVRQTRSELNKNAERASIEVFATNLKKLLLTPPFRGHAVLGIDPGFRHGCKTALIDLNGKVLEAGIINLNCGIRTWDLRDDGDAQWLRKILLRHRCEVIALGNGTACRETEEYLSELLQMNYFKPLDVSYTIVNEQGASIYSCSDEARKDFPNTDPNLISAASIARRLQDPLAELVKVEPKHLGIGMYQHDLPQKKLACTLDEIVMECVSFVGVDLNTASHCLLRRVAGINSSKADKILEHRLKNGPFVTREDIKKVKGVGEKSYEQCAGFIRIIPESVGHETAARKCNPLDRTWIHPESYPFAMRVLEYCQVRVGDIGTGDSIKRIEKAIASAGGISTLSVKLDAEEPLVKLVTDGLMVPKNHDLRSEFEKPLFRKGLTSIRELQSGDILTGRITNTTHFGAFVDIGVGQNGLIHNSGMGGKHPQLGDKVQVKIKNVELARQRIGLDLLAII